jgi:hypothetical protein
MGGRITLMRAASIGREDDDEDGGGTKFFEAEKTVAAPARAEVLVSLLIRAII